MNTPLEALERLKGALDIADRYAAGVHFGEGNTGYLSFAALRSLLSSYEAQGERLREVAEYLCRIEGALLADDLDMKLNFPGEPSPTAMAERILPGFDSIEYDLSRAALTQPPAVENGE